MATNVQQTSSHIFTVLFAGTELVAEQKLCKDGRWTKEGYKTMGECFYNCKEYEMFIFSRGEHRCKDDKCYCQCTTIDFPCELKDHPGYDIYRYTNEGEWT